MTDSPRAICEPLRSRIPIGCAPGTTLISNGRACQIETELRNCTGVYANTRCAADGAGSVRTTYTDSMCTTRDDTPETASDGWVFAGGISATMGCGHITIVLSYYSYRRDGHF